MSAPDLDVPMTPSADQVRRREFVTIRRGYDPEQVRAYLKQVGDQIERLEEQVRAAHAETAAAIQAQAQLQADAERAAEKGKEDAYANLSERMADMLRTAEGHASDIRREAEEEANRMRAEARSEADRIRIDAQEKAEQARQEADDLKRKTSEEADRMLMGLGSRREALVAELEEMRGRLLAMAQNIAAIADRDEDAAPPPETVSIWESPGDGGTSEPSPPDAVLADPAFAGLWGEEDPLADLPTLSLDDIEPDDPFQ